MSERPSFDQDIDYDEDSGEIRDHSTSRGFPLGGLGTGGFSVFTDGGFGMFRTNNNWFNTPPKAKQPKGTFLALRAEAGGRSAARILRRSYRGGAEYRNITAVSHTSFRGELPFFELDYADQAGYRAAGKGGGAPRVAGRPQGGGAPRSDNPPQGAALPVAVSLSGFTSLVPHNTKDSSLPVVFFEVRVSNPGPEAADVSLLVSFENILGVGGSGTNPLYYPLDGSVTYNRTRGNYAEPIEMELYTGLSFKTRQNYGGRDPRRRVVGEYLLVTDRPAGEGAAGEGAAGEGGAGEGGAGDAEPATLSVCSRWDSGRARPTLLGRFAGSGSLPEHPERRGNAAAFSVSFSLSAGSSRTVPLYLLWWTPHHVIEKRQRLRKLTGRHRGTDFGHYYENCFSSADELARYAVRNRARLKRETAELPDLVRGASLPSWLKRYVLNSADAVLTNSVLPRDGTLYTIEGMPWGWPFGALTGTIDQRLASHPYTAAFFTGIDRAELRSFLELTQNGQVPHGNGHADIALGTNDIPYGNPIESFNETEVWTDLPQSTILQLGKLILQTGDITLLEDSWPRMLEMMRYLDESLEDDIPEGITTYDYMHYRPSFVYSAILHCATLQMMTRLGRLLSVDGAVLEPLEAQLTATRRAAERLLWDERGFFRTCRGRDTVFTAALAGDWICRYAGLDSAIPYERALSHSEWQTRVLVDSYRVMSSRAGATRPLVYREADPAGNEMPALKRGFKLYRVNNPWQSIAYQGIEAIFLGRTGEGLQLLKRVWEKGWYEGYPWDMDHWGMRGRTYMTHPLLWIWDNDHHGTEGHVYMTHPAMWSAFAALTGVTYDAFGEQLTFSPRPLPGQEEFRIPAFLPGFWLDIEYSDTSGEAAFTVAKHFGTPVGAKTVRWQQPDGTGADISLEPPVVLEEGARFVVERPGRA